MCAPLSCARCTACCGRKGLLWEEEPGRVIAEWREDGTDVSLSITAEEKAFGTELTVSLRRPCDGIPEQRAYRLLQEMLDQIVRHLENTLMTKGEERRLKNARFRGQEV